MPASPARKRRHQEKRRAEAARLEAKRADEERPLQTVPEREPEPPSDEVNFMLPPGGMMGGNRSVPLKKTLIVPAPLNAHLLMFQVFHQGNQYKVQNGSLALWRMLLREEHEMVEEARRLAKETGLPADPRRGPVMRRFEQELKRMAAEESGDIFDE